MKRPLHGVLRETVSAFFADDCPSLAAAVSFYAIFSLPPLLVLFTLVTGSLLDPETARHLLSSRVGSLLGPEGTDAVLALLENTTAPGQQTPAALIGIVALLFGSTSAFARLQTALNRAWGVPAGGGVRGWLLKRALSLVMVFVLGVFVLLSGASGAVFAALGTVASARELPDLGLLSLAGTAVSFGFGAVLFAILFLYVPDARVPVRTALLGGVVTAALFLVGRAAIGEYTARTSPGSAFGAAGTFAAALLWLYYNANILFLGAEFTEVWSRRQGRPLDGSDT